MQERWARIAALAAIMAAAALLTAAVGKAADNYPSRPIVLVIPLPPGGTNDIMARAVADRMSDTLGQRIVIENRNAGGSGHSGDARSRTRRARRLHHHSRLHLDIGDRSAHFRQGRLQSARGLC